MDKDIMIDLLQTIQEKQRDIVLVKNLYNSNEFYIANKVLKLDTKKELERYIKIKDEELITEFKELDKVDTKHIFRVLENNSYHSLKAIMNI